MNRCDCPNELDEGKLQAELLRCAPRDRLLVVMGLETGLRLSELLSLRTGGVWKNGAPVSVLRVSRRQLKGGRGPRARSVYSRAIPLNERAREALSACLSGEPENPEAPLFPSRKGGKTLGRRQGTRIVRKIFLNAGLDPNRVWGAHSLRRRF